MSQNGSAPRRATKQCLGLVLNVCYWHLADVPLALTNVCFEGKNGHDAHAPLCRLMTQSGLCPLLSPQRAKTAAAGH
jgi:hypothetical protein